uniref:Ferritin n=1 Tax=Ciona savignyi TaxID=51511 RepID=H2YJB8_CIOSA
MNSVLLCCVIALMTSSALALKTCQTKICNLADSQVDERLNRQIGVELKGHYTYLYLSHIFEQHTHYYPKVAKYFRAKSNEEMSHAERFIQYQNQRGGNFNIASVQRKNDNECANVDSVLKGFACAKVLEIEVTEALTDLLSFVSAVPVAGTDIHGASNATNDLRDAQPILVHHGRTTKPLASYECNRLSGDITVEYVELTEMIAHEFLGHQIEDTKEIANHEQTLKNFGSANEALGSFLADKHLEL